MQNLLTTPMLTLLTSSEITTTVWTLKNNKRRTYKILTRSCV